MIRSGVLQNSGAFFFLGVTERRGGRWQMGWQMQIRWILSGVLIASIVASCSSDKAKDKNKDKDTEGAAGAGAFLRGHGSECEDESDCHLPETVPEDCAEAVCESGYCLFLAKDEDNDGFPTRRCTSREPGVAVVTGSDCNDSSDEVNPNGWDGPADKDFEDGCNDDIDQDCNGLYDDATLNDGTSCVCIPGQTGSCGTSEVGWPLNFPELVAGEPLGACRLGSRECLPNGSWGQCVGAVGPSPETCDGKDNDCDGIPSLEDVDDLVDISTYACDGDNDGYLDPNSVIELSSCSEPTESCGTDDGGRWISNPLPGAYTDCDDDDANAFPGHIELCDEIDNNCNGVVDDSPPNAPTWSYDQDGDGFRAANFEVLQQCEKPKVAPSACSGDCPMDAWYPLILAAGDCDDKNSQHNPSARDACDGIDADCDGSGFTGCACDESSPPTPCQIPKIGEVSVDGVGECRSGMDTCIDGKWSGCNNSVGPKPELCGDLDLNCNGLVGSEDPAATNQEHYVCDVDGDGHLAPNGSLEIDACTTPPQDCGAGNGVWVANPQPGLFDDCDDSNKLRYPGNAEICDGVDNDCDGDVDDNAVNALIWSYDPDGDSFRNGLVATVTQCAAPTEAPVGCDSPGLDLCVDSPTVWVGQGQPLPAGDCDEGDSAINPSGRDPCTGVDANCDGSVLSGCACTVGDAPQICGAHPGFDGIGRCQAGSETCASGSWAGCVGSVGKSFERCGSEDYDCDGLIGNNDPDSVDLRTFVCDEDSDGFVRRTSAPTPPITTQACDTSSIPTVVSATCPGTWLENPPLSLFSDCDDANDEAYPGRVEVCDGVDNDCDDDIDGDAVDRKVWSFDPDKDGFQSNTSFSVFQCFAPTEPPGTCSGCPSACDSVLCPEGATNWVPRTGELPANDCDDSNKAKNPNATDRCDGEDWDCDLAPNTGCDCQIGSAPQVCGTSSEGETGACQSGLQECMGGFWGACVGAVGPAVERCGNVDYDCDGTVGNLDDTTPDLEKLTFTCDADSDGFISNGSLTTAATTLACGLSYIVDSCAGTWREGATTGSDCDDGNPNAHVGAKEYCGTEDLDCDGIPGNSDSGAVDQDSYVCDMDGDGHLDANSAPASQRSCTAPSEALCNSGGGNWVVNPPPSLFDDCDDGDSGVSPGGTLEICDSVDNNCDGVIDTDAVDQVIWSYDADGDGFRDNNADTVVETCFEPSIPASCSGSCPSTGWRSGTSALPTGDCDDQDPSVQPKLVWSLDADGDGFAARGSSRVVQCTSPGAGYVSGSSALPATDCADADASRNPNASEFCDDIDNDCDDEIDEGAVDQLIWSYDADGDGYRDSINAQVKSCNAPVLAPGTCATSSCPDNSWTPGIGALPGGDCNDNNAGFNPLSAWSLDVDRDGYSPEGSSASIQCASPGGSYVRGILPPTDCDDSKGNINPSAAELCDTIDNNCDDVIDTDSVNKADFYCDADGDGRLAMGSFGSGETQCSTPSVSCSGDWIANPGSSFFDDCNDSDADMSPKGVAEICDGKNNDCSGGQNWSNASYADEAADLVGSPNIAGTSFICNGVGGWTIPGGTAEGGGCPTETLNCNGNANDGCETDGTTLSNCGSCTNTCNFSCLESSATHGCVEVAEVWAGKNHNCVTMEDGSLACWGAGAGGQIGDGFYLNRDKARPISAMPNVSTVDGGDNFSCALDGAGTLHCWGQNDVGQLGDNSTESHSQPADIVMTAIGSVASFCAGSEHACAVDSTGQLWCWGNRDNGRTGSDSFSTNAYDTQPFETWDGENENLMGASAGSGAVSEVVCGARHTCALAGGGSIYCSTDGTNAQDGNATTPSRGSFLKVSASSGYSAIASGDNHLCAIKSGKVYCWGSNSSGQAGQSPASTTVTTPTEVPGFSSATMIAAGGRTSCAVQAGTLSCWGSDASGQLGGGGSTHIPTVIASVSSVSSLAVGDAHVCVQETAGSAVKCWGANLYGQLGRGNSSSGSWPVPTPISPLFEN